MIVHVVPMMAAMRRSAPVLRRAGDVARFRPLLILDSAPPCSIWRMRRLLPLVGQKLALSHKDLAIAMMSACIVAAQLIMLPIAVVVGRTSRPGRTETNPADRVWRAASRHALHAFRPGLVARRRAIARRHWCRDFWCNPAVLIADLMRGTGRYNLAQGAIATLQGVGASAAGYRQARSSTIWAIRQPPGLGCYCSCGVLGACDGAARECRSSRRKAAAHVRKNSSDARANGLCAGGAGFGACGQRHWPRVRRGVTGQRSRR